MRLRGSLGLLSLATLAAAAHPVVAQSVGRTDERAELEGEVIASDTREPIAGVWIALQGRGFGTYSRGDGRFRLPDVPSAPRRYDVQALGYLSTTVTLQPGSDLLVTLQPDESLLPGVRFVLDHLEERRNGARFFDQEAMAFSGAFDLRELLATRGVHGVRKFCLDERWAPGLGGSPPGGFYMMEIHGGTARLYTEEFLTEMAAADAETVRRVVRPEQPIC
jgi:hypothetical protein